jgi:hypothetical protein
VATSDAVERASHDLATYQGLLEAYVIPTLGGIELQQLTITMDTYSHVLPGLDERAAATVAQLILEGDQPASISIDKPLTNGTRRSVEQRDREGR